MSPITLMHNFIIRIQHYHHIIITMLIDLYFMMFQSKLSKNINDLSFKCFTTKRNVTIFVEQLFYYSSYRT